MKKTKVVSDSIIAPKQINKTKTVASYSDVVRSRKSNKQALLLGGHRTEFFVTEDSRKYVSQKQQHKFEINYEYIDSRGFFDSLQVRYVKNQANHAIYRHRLVAEFRKAEDIADSFREALRLDMSPVRMWQMSLAGAVLFGMISMSMIYRNLGQSAMAKMDEGVSTQLETVQLVKENSATEEKADKKEEKEISQKEKEAKEKDVKKSKENLDKEEAKEVKEKEKIQEKEVAKEKISKQNKQEEIKEKTSEEKTIKQEQLVKKRSIDSAMAKENKKEKEYSLENNAREMVEGYPIEKMLPYILEQDPEVAKYLIAIAKQESQWGKRVPVLNGQDCYNYWGYRGKRKLMGTGGHTCFNSRKDAVETVGKRIHELIYKYDRKSAKRLIVWKCGSSCAGHSQAGVDRWIGTVDMYYKKLSK